MLADLQVWLGAAERINGGSSKGELVAISKSLDLAWNDFRAVYNSSEHRPAIDYNAIMSRYIKSSGKLNDFLQGNNVNRSSHSDIRYNLPELKLLDFNDSYTDWQAYIVRFDKLVHNNGFFDNGAKIDYLKMTIKGDAAKLIKHIDPIPENYLVCYDLLRKRYDNKRETVNRFLSKIL